MATNFRPRREDFRRANARVFQHIFELLLIHFLIVELVVLIILSANYILGPVHVIEQLIIVRVLRVRGLFV